MPANFSLTSRTWELGRAPRWLVYLAKAAQGAGMALLFLAIEAALLELLTPAGWRGVRHPLFLSLAGFGVLYAAVAMKVTGIVEAGWGFDPLDWICDLALFSVWAVPFALAAGNRVLALAIVLAWAATYPWSKE